CCVDPFRSQAYSLALHDALPILRRKGGRQLSLPVFSPSAGTGTTRAVLVFQTMGWMRTALHSFLTKCGFHSWLEGMQCCSHPSRSEEHTSELQSLRHLVCRLLLE